MLLPSCWESLESQEDYDAAEGLMMQFRLTVAFAISSVVACANVGVAQLSPPFGGVPAGLSGGVGFVGGGVSGSLRFNFGQTSSRSISSTAASLTTLDGYPGSISSTVTRPFVTGFTPIVGGYPEIPDPAEEITRQDQQQFSRILQSQQKLNQKSLQKYLSRAERAEREGNKRMARAAYKRAIGLADPPFRAELQRRLHEMLQR